MKQNSITLKQREALIQLGFPKHIGTGYFYISDDKSDWFPVPTVDEAIDWLRKERNVIIYNAVEPVVDPCGSKKILFRFAVKWCNLRDGWNGRKYIGSTRFAGNIYSLKREAITKALQWLKQKQNGNK